jgi:hypothetical protein
VALLVVSAFELHSRDSCYEPSGSIWVGETLDLVLDQPTWLHMQSQPDHLYRIEMTGTDGGSLEIWTSTFDSFSSCTMGCSPLESDEVTGGMASVIWTSEGCDRTVQLIPAKENNQEAVTVSFEEVAAPPAGEVQVIPAVAHAPGVGGTFFQTDLTVFNPYSEEITAELRFLTAPGKTGNGTSAEITVAPQQVLAVDDVVLSLLGLDNATGALMITSQKEKLMVISRTYTEDESGTYGQLIPAADWRDAAGQIPWWFGGSRRDLLQLADSASFRSNIGFVEVFGTEAEIEIELRDQTGLSIGQTTITLPPFSHRQINDIFSFIGAPSQDHASASVNLTSHGRLLSYASIIDNFSADSTYVPGLAEIGGNNVLYLPVAASTFGSFGSRWRTDLRAVTAVDPPYGLRVTFYPSDGSTPLASSFPFAAGGVIAIDDLVGQLGGSGTGAVRLEAVTEQGGSSNDSFNATSRTYNTTAKGTYGQLIPAQINTCNWGVVLGVERSDEFRTNVGMFNPSDQYPAEVLVSLVSETGGMIGSRSWRLEPLRHLQINDIFWTLNVPWQANCRVDFEVQHISQRILAYGSKIDNRSGDSVYLPAMEHPEDPGPTPIELSNRDNSILLDQLDEAVGIEQLPEGVLTASLSGSGDLGRPELPIGVLCLYKSPAGELRSAVLGIGDSISDIGGGERFWCVIPDWISTNDNAGTVTVSITGGDTPVELVLDARDNAVLLDERAESVIAGIPSSETFHIKVNGNLGRPELGPQVVTMQRNVDDGSLLVRAFGDGGVVDRVDPEQQLLVVVVDWIQRDDNTGTTTLEPSCTMRSVTCGEQISGSIGSNDCSLGPRGRRIWAQSEKVVFAGIAGQVVRLTATWYPQPGQSNYGNISLLDPSGTLIAESGFDYDVSEILPLTLQTTGTYTVWVQGPTLSGIDYTLELSCPDTGLMTPINATAEVNPDDALKTIDDNPYELSALTTYWQAVGDVEACITYDMGRTMRVAGLRETAGPFPGNPFVAYVSTGGVDFTEVYQGDLTSYAYGWHAFDPVDGQYIALCIQRTNDTGYGELADFRALVPD